MAFRVFHSSDWHLGRTFLEASLLDDQAWVLDRLVDALRDTRPDALVVAGDIYDRAVPSKEAVELLDDVLCRIADLGIPVVAIAGNHDSPERLSFGSRLLERSQVHLRGTFGGEATPVLIPGKGYVYAAPFIDPDDVRTRLGDDSLRGHAAATDRVLAAAREDAARRDLPTVLVAHAFVQGALATPDSERPLSVGTAGSVPAAVFAGFDYAALGHLHGPQEVAPGVRYSGSLLKYSFSEAAHEKAGWLVEVERGAARASPIRLGQRRDVAQVRGTLSELLSRADLARREADYIDAVLTDEGYVVDAMNSLRRRFPYILNVRRDPTLPGLSGTFATRVAGTAGDDQALFHAFFQDVTGAAPGDAQSACFAAAVEAVERKERAS
jgi:exonuclease SbcD